MNWDSWNQWQKALATLAVDIPLVLFLWWLLWKSRWAKPKEQCPHIRIRHIPYEGGWCMDCGKKVM